MVSFFEKRYTLLFSLVIHARAKMTRMAVVVVMAVIAAAVVMGLVSGQLVSTVYPAGSCFTKFSWPQDVTLVNMSMSATNGITPYAQTLPYPYTPPYPADPTGNLNMFFNIDLIVDEFVQTLEQRPACMYIYLYAAGGGTGSTQMVQKISVPTDPTTWGRGRATVRKGGTQFDFPVGVFGTYAPILWTYQIQITDQYATRIFCYQFEWFQSTQSDAPLPPLPPPRNLTASDLQC